MGRMKDLVSDDWDRAYREGYVDALGAAREAVESVWTLDPSWDGTNWNNALYEALAAIDALREEKP